MHDDFDWNALYTGTTSDYEPPDPLMLRIIDELPPGRALDVGCGAGGLVVALLERGWTATGVDVAPRAIAAARAVLDQRSLTAELHVGNAASWQPPTVYDLVTNSFALPAARADQAAVFRTMRDALAPGGVVLLEDFDKPPTANPTFARFHCPTADELREAFAGFDIVRAEIVDTPPHLHADPADHTQPWTALLFHARKPAS